MAISIGNGVVMGIGSSGTILAGINSSFQFTTPALMNSSSVYANMTSVTVNSSGLFVTVGTNGSGYPIYATANSTNI